MLDRKPLFTLATIAGIAGLTLSASCQRNADPTQSTTSQPADTCAFSLRLTALGPAPGFQEMVIEKSNERIWIANAPSLSCSDVREAHVEDDDAGHCFLLIQFNADGARKLEQLTRAHLKDRLAIMSRDRVVLAPRIESEISDGRMSLIGAYTWDELDTIGRAIRGQP